MAGGGLIATTEDLLKFAREFRRPGFLSDSSLALIWRPTVIRGVESQMSYGWYPRSNPARLGIGGSNAGLQAGLSVWKDQDLVVAVLANTWGRGSRNGELMNDRADGLIGRLAAVCGNSASTRGAASPFTRGSRRDRTA